MSKYFVKPKSKIFFILILAIFIIVGLGVFVIGDEVFAQDQQAKTPQDICKDASNIWLQTYIPGGIGQCVKGFPEYLRALYNLFIGVVGILAVIMIMAGGFQWLLAAGNTQRISGAKTTIISAIMGLVLALMSYTMLSLINPKLTILQLRGIKKVTLKLALGNFCPKDGKNMVAESIGQSVQTIPADAYKISSSQAECGKTYFIQGEKGNTCDGTKCPGSKYCYERMCFEEKIFGKISCQTNDGKCVDYVHLKALCKKGNDFNVEEVGSDNTDERDVSFKIKPDYADICLGDGELKGFFMRIEVKDNGNDDDRGLASSSISDDGNYWQSNGPLNGCYDKDPDTFSPDEWNQVVQNKQLLPIDIFEENKLPLVYDIILGEREAWSVEHGHCK